MTDGILDLLTAILVLGIVLAVAFGFILPLTNTEFMQFNEQYEDKGSLNNVIDYSDPSDFEHLTQRLYTYEELLLLLSIQDDRMQAPNAINLSNLITSKDMSYSGYSADYPGQGKTNSKTYLNTLFNKANTRTDEVLSAIIRYADNHLTVVDGGAEYPDVYGDAADVAKKNIGLFTISDGFFEYTYPILSTLNGAEIVNASASGAVAEYRYTNDPARLSETTTVISPSNAKYKEKQMYYISHHFAIPDDSKYLTRTIKGVDMTQFQRYSDDEDAFFVEVLGDFPRDNIKGHTYKDKYGVTKQGINTYLEYQNYLSILRKNVYAVD